MDTLQGTFDHLTKGSHDELVLRNSSSPGYQRAHKPEPRRVRQVDDWLRNKAPGTRMLLPSSGRQGFENVRAAPSLAGKVSREQMKAMLEHENALRLSEEYQEALDQLGECEDADVEALYLQLQQRVARQAGLPASIGVKALRSFQALFPDDAELQSIPLYVKYNRSKQGTLREGDPVPSTPLATLNGNVRLLNLHLTSSVPTKAHVLISGSGS